MPYRMRLALTQNWTGRWWKRTVTAIAARSCKSGDAIHMKELEGRTSIVTGGGIGIGFTNANVLADAGATVFAVSRTGGTKGGGGSWS
ncbi:MAG: hypothetical protein VB071_03985 [Lawsonibacter sp.]|nr:hypothetical protein [Lawsonibacter sp.]